MSRGGIIITVCLSMLAGAIGRPARGDEEAPSPSSSAELRRLFEDANALYESGEYEAAIERYLAVVGAGAANPDLYYNLGNAYYRTNDLGNAVLFYERALRLNPRERDARENLALVREQLQDKQFVGEQNRFVRGIVWLHNNLSAGEMLLFASCSYLVLCLLAVVLIFRESDAVRALYRRLSILSPGRLVGLSLAKDVTLAMGVAATLLVTSGLSSYTKIARERNRREAVVLAKEVPVYSGPTDDATLQFRIHEGTMVSIREERSDWVKVQLRGGLSGWVSSTSIEKV